MKALPARRTARMRAPNAGEMGAPLANQNILALYPDLASARAAMDALGRAGIEAGKVSLGGPGAARAGAKLETVRRDARILKFVGVRTLFSGFVGAGLAALIAWLAAPSGSVFAVAVVAGVVAGGAIGGMIGGVASLDISAEWELTFENTTEGRVIVSVHSDDPADMEDAEAAFDAHPPVRTRRVDRRGRLAR